MGKRAQDAADMLAHHYVTALELAEATKNDRLADSLRERSIRFLSLAGAKARYLDLAASERNYARALRLTSPDSPDRSRLLASWVDVLIGVGRIGEAVAPLKEAAAQHVAAGERRLAARALLSLDGALEALGQPEWRDCMHEALELTEEDGPCLELMAALRRARG